MKRLHHCCYCKFNCLTAVQNIEWQNKFRFLIMLYLIHEMLLKAYCALGCHPHPPQKHHPLFLAKSPPLNLQNVQASPCLFRQLPPLYWFFGKPFICVCEIPYNLFSSVFLHNCLIQFFFTKFF